MFEKMIRKKIGLLVKDQLDEYALMCTYPIGTVGFEFSQLRINVLALKISILLSLLGGIDPEK